jgi:hypothetical protein
VTNSLKWTTVLQEEESSTTTGEEAVATPAPVSQNENEEAQGKFLFTYLGIKEYYGGRH